MGEMHTTLELRKGLAEREGMSVEERLSRILEPYTRKLSGAAEVLEVFKASYTEEGLLW